jgi:hydrogenase maturation protein HypF
MITRSQIMVKGIVQGVGFRPFIYSHASRLALCGRVLNNTTGVLIEVEGNHGAIEQFISDITANPPPLSTIESVECSHDLAPVEYSDFLILESAHEGERFVPISPDISTCDDCLTELFDPQDRRFQYPFINCTNCGPRFTIVENVPYDREFTTMRDFVMCRECRVEYEDPLNRRFHAEPTACSRCGPQLYLLDATGYETSGGADRARELLLEGKIVAVKGVGGFHLACDALNPQAVETLRTRKYREDKPFAMMAGSVAVIKEYCCVSRAEEKLLTARERPIVLLARRGDCPITRAVAPGVHSLGFMLPYSPIHYLLMRQLNRPLVMTSGNVSDEPICFADGDAIKRLSNIADYFLLHDRRIHMRTDDSVVRVIDGREAMVRRSRGYAPAPLKTPFNFERQILACGAELKNTFCLTRDHYAFLSHHIGDLENLETLQSFIDGIEHFKRLFNLQPEAIAYDLHPEYLSTKYALAQAEIGTKLGVQHHHAHIASCMVDNGIDGAVIGVAMDGLGFGVDGKLWGGEFFVADYADAERIAHLDYVPLAGGARAIREPWRMAATYLHQAFGDEFLDLELGFVNELAIDSWKTLRSMSARGVNSPHTSSMGRLFDAVSGLLQIRSAVNYEGQAAIELEAMADAGCADWYEFLIDENTIDARAVIRGAVEDLLDGQTAARVSGKFHNSVARLIESMALRIREERHLYRVVMSGGVFQNVLLVNKTCRLLRAAGFEVFTHLRVPTNDGGISLGQAAVANARLKSGRT